MKKKILSLCLVCCLVAVAAIGGTLAYFTDTDTETNKFTVGNIKIDLEEIFVQDSELMPGEWNTTAVTKEVYVRNVGDNDAYMWVELLIPAALDRVPDGNVQNPAYYNSLHWNSFDTYKNNDTNKLELVKQSVAQAPENAGKYTLVAETMNIFRGTEIIGTVTYNKYLVYINNDTAKKTNQATNALLAQVYMDSAVKQCTDKTHAAGCLVLKSGAHYTGTWEMIVNAYGIQADGIANIKDAINTYYGTTVVA